MTYDMMGVHELVEKAMEMMALLALRGIEIDYKELEKIELALRRVVIREASVGQVFFTTDEHPVAIGAKELKVGGRTFDLILKETT